MANINNEEMAAVTIDKLWNEEPSKSFSSKVVWVPIDHSWDEPSPSVPIDHSWDEQPSSTYNPQIYVEKNLILRVTPPKLSKTQKKI